MPSFDFSLFFLQKEGGFSVLLCFCWVFVATFIVFIGFFLVFWHFNGSCFFGGVVVKRMERFSVAGFLFVFQRKNMGRLSMLHFHCFSENKSKHQLLLLYSIVWGFCRKVIFLGLSDRNGQGKVENPTGLQIILGMLSIYMILKKKKTPGKNPQKPMMFLVI